MGADRRHAGHLIACAFVVGPDDQIDNVFYMSFDRGRTWSHTLTVPVAVDPSCEIGPGGLAFAAGIHDLPDGKATPVLTVNRSGDGGHTWKPSSISVDTRPIDRPYLTVDDTDGSAFSGQVYVHAYRFSRSPPAAVLFYPSTNEGSSFENVLVTDATTFEKPWFFPGNGVVESDGTFFALVAELDDTKRNMSYRTDAASAPAAANAVLNVLVSRDGGKTLGLAGRIPDVYYDWRVPQVCMPALAVDRSHGPFHDQLYAVWPDARYDRRTQILLSCSSDHGRTWVRFSASLDGGRTWLPSVRVSTAAHLASDDTRKNSGDTAGLAADADGVFHPVWIDNRTGIPQMRTATVRVRTKGHPRFRPKQLAPQSIYP